MKPAKVNLDNWQEGPANRWAFQHVDALMRTTDISRGTMPVREFADERQPVPTEFDDFLLQTCTDGLLVLKGSTVVIEHYANTMEASTRHLLMSVSKSLCSTIFGQYVATGAINCNDQVSHYVPELEGSAYSDATVQQVLDMTAAVQFDETYVDPKSDVQTQDRVAGWRSPLPGDPVDSYAFLATLQKSGVHGEVYEYCSANTDVLAWILERVSGSRYAELLTSKLWSRLGAEYDAYVTVDNSGFPMANAGVCTTLRDLARFGRLVLDDGVNHLGEQVIPRPWLAETRRGGNNSIAGERMWEVHPDGCYRNQFWITGDPNASLYGIGIHGQYVWMNPAADLVVAKLSSLPDPDDDNDWASHIDFFHRLDTLFS